MMTLDLNEDGLPVGFPDVDELRSFWQEEVTDAELVEAFLKEFGLEGLNVHNVLRSRILIYMRQRLFNTAKQKFLAETHGTQVGEAHIDRISNRLETLIEMTFGAMSEGDRLTFEWKHQELLASYYRRAQKVLDEKHKKRLEVVSEGKKLILPDDFAGK
jgi:hypothetical protein